MNTTNTACIYFIKSVLLSPFIDWQIYGPQMYAQVATWEVASVTNMIGKV